MEGDLGAGLLLGGGAHHGERLHDLAVLERYAVMLGVAPHLGHEAGGQRVHYRATHAVQAARHLVGTGIELAARVQFSEDDLDGGAPFALHGVDGDTAAVVGHAGRTVLVEGYLYGVGEASQALVDGVVDYLGKQLMVTVDPGTTLRVPNGNTLAVGGPAPLSVQVRPGDSLWSLASVHGSSVESLMETNGLQNDRLVVGQTLTITPESIASPKPRPNPDGLIWPLDGIITSTFGYRVLFGSNFHNGLDINGNTGDPIRAAVGGVVTFAGWHGGYGNLLVITHNDKEFYYGHASKLLATVGEVVEQGDLVALVGSTGNSTGAHLHFEIRIDGESVDPLPHLPIRAGQ